MPKAFAEVGGKFVAVESSNKDLAKQARDLLRKAVDRNARDRELVRALADAATRWTKQADELRWRGSTGDELARFYKSKAESCINEAARIIAEGDR
jgi:hypothetical protein